MAGELGIDRQVEFTGRLERDELARRDLQVDVLQCDQTARKTLVYVLEPDLIARGVHAA